MEELREETGMRARKEECSWIQNKMGRAHIQHGKESVASGRGCKG